MEFINIENEKNFFTSNEENIEHTIIIETRKKGKRMAEDDDALFLPKTLIFFGCLFAFIPLFSQIIAIYLNADIVLELAMVLSFFGYGLFLF